MSRAIAVWRDVSKSVFEQQILPAGQPAVLKGLADHWPMVERSRRSPQDLVDYLKAHNTGTLVTALVGEPEIRGRFFYTDDLQRLNFETQQGRFGAFLDLLMARSADTAPPALAAQAIPLDQHLPQILASHNLDLPPPQTIPKMWIGNRTIVAAHFDLNENIACVVAGRRRFTLFPPEQVKNLYIGPVEVTPAGVPISLVDFDAPDFERHPRFEQALAAAQVAELEPGDAIYIPYLWWHHVQSLAPFNILVNYWWNPAAAFMGNPFYSLIHAALAIGALPPSQKAAWSSFFEHFVFQTEGTPPERSNLFTGDVSAEKARFLRSMIAQSLTSAR